MMLITGWDKGDESKELCDSLMSQSVMAPARDNSDSIFEFASEIDSLGTERQKLFSCLYSSHIYIGLGISGEE